MSQQLVTTDICVVGAGSGGLSVAAAVLSFGVDTVIVEGGRMGGDCLNYGCVPSKALIAAAKSAHSCREGGKFGIHATPEVDFAAVKAHIDGVIAAIEPHDSAERFERLGARVIREYGRFIGPDCVRAGKFDIRARRFVIATGSRAATPPVAGLDTVGFLTNETVFSQTRLPEHLIVIGGGPIGLELAQAFRRLGAQVSVVEALHALARDEPDCRRIVLDALRAEGVSILEKARIENISRGEKGGNLRLDLKLEDGHTHTLQGSDLLVAAGRRANTETLDLDKAGITISGNAISTDASLRTKNRRVYAIGDCIGGLQFTHVAGFHAGQIARALLFRLPVAIRTDHLPWITYTDPQIGHVGMTRARALERHGGKMQELSADFSENDRARAERHAQGKLKLYVGPRGRLLGADMAGPAAGEIINLLSMAIARRMSVGQLMSFVSPYPTHGDLIKRAATNYFRPATQNRYIRSAIRLLARLG